MAMRTFYDVQIWILNEEGEADGYRGSALAVDMNQALEAAKRLMSRRIASITGGKVMKVEITVYEHDG